MGAEAAGEITKIQRLLLLWTEPDLGGRVRCPSACGSNAHTPHTEHSRFSRPFRLSWDVFTFIFFQNGRENGEEATSKQGLADSVAEWSGTVPTRIRGIQTVM
jgi:hypothetical protein